MVVVMSIGDDEEEEENGDGVGAEETDAVAVGGVIVVFMSVVALYS